MWQPDADSPKRAEISKLYDESDGNLVIWYRKRWDEMERKNKKRDFGFSRLVESVRLAREIMDASCLKINQDPLDHNSLNTIKKHFAIDPTNRGDSGRFKIIKMRFGEIQTGLNGQMVICIAKNLKSDRGRVMGKGNERRIHINKKLVCDESDVNFNSTLAIARTVIHESAHFFANCPGTITGGFDSRDELYAHHQMYWRKNLLNTEDEADRYAWAAISLHHGHELSPESLLNLEDVSGRANFADSLGCKDC